jgi:hypothetical protein
MSSEGETMIVISGHLGSDAGAVILNSDGSVTVIPGWGQGAFEDFRAAVHVIHGASHIKTPGVAGEVIKGAYKFVESELDKYVKAKQGERVIVLVDH